MKTKSKKIELIFLSFCMTLVGACSSSSDQQEEENAELEANSEENLGNMDMGNNVEGSDNFSESTENSGTTNNMLSENNEISDNNLANLTGNNTAPVDMATEAIDPGIVESIPSNPSLNATIAQNPASGGNIAALPMNQATPNNTASTNSNTSVQGNMASTTTMTAGAGKVKYVSESSVAMVDQPSNGAAVVGTLDKGDHPLVVSESAEFVMLSNGKYVPARSLSEKGVGRAKKDAIWK